MRLRIRSGDVTLVNNAVFEDRRLTWGALGLLVTLASMDEGESVEDDRLMQIGACSIAELEELKQELRDCGYLVALNDGSEMLIEEVPGGDE